MDSLFTGARVLITGGTGSFGHAFVQSLLDTAKPARLVIYSRDELKQYEMAQRFPLEDYPAIRYFIGDIRDESRLKRAMDGIDYVVHAAALKHVPTAEYNPFECIRTNVHGAENVVSAAIDAGVRKVIALSTDKACNPINLYGASKLASDKIFVAANSLAGARDTRFAVVRYGNVVGSRGSVLPYFQRLVAEGAKDLPITDDRMTRFWITLKQGVDFVANAFGWMEGGEIFVPKIPSMRVVDLARAVAPDLPHRVVGIRPGEKLHEVMVGEDDARNTIEYDDRYVILPTFHPWRAGDIPHGQGKPVADGFRYASDTNDRWFEVETMRDLLASGDV
ncbi:MAG: UDP-N-acetylglucosamine 4,6-dehydratase (inverting) [Rhodospirillaceae bacterium]|nr:UDP-N-acetylglucosamine 4,6-dehydratase (inverting) [Rhodospirillaceae bacterium]